MKFKFRLKEKGFYYCDMYEDTIITYYRPVLQIKILWFWITIKKFLYDDNLEAKRDSNKIFKLLIKENTL